MNDFQRSFLQMVEVVTEKSPILSFDIGMMLNEAKPFLGDDFISHDPTVGLTPDCLIDFINLFIQDINDEVKESENKVEAVKNILNGMPFDNMPVTRAFLAMVYKLPDD